MTRCQFYVSVFCGTKLNIIKTGLNIIVHLQYVCWMTRQTRSWSSCDCDGCNISRSSSGKTDEDVEYGSEGLKNKQLVKRVKSSFCLCVITAGGVSPSMALRTLWTWTVCLNSGRTSATLTRGESQAKRWPTEVWCLTGDSVFVSLSSVRLLTCTIWKASLAERRPGPVSLSWRRFSLTLETRTTSPVRNITVSKHNFHILKYKMCLCTRMKHPAFIMTTSTFDMLTTFLLIILNRNMFCFLLLYLMFEFHIHQLKRRKLFVMQLVLLSVTKYNVFFMH